MPQTVQQHAQGAAERLARNPHEGALFRIAYRQASRPDTTITGPLVFDHVEVGFGRTREEALVDILRTPTLSRTLGVREQVQYELFWEQPKVASKPSELRTPFPKRVLAGAPERTLVLQDVKWGPDGFDDEGTSTVSVGQDGTFSFFVLAVPPRLALHTIPVRDRGAIGGTVPAVNLDPDNPFNVHAAAVFPANEATLHAFEQARQLEAEVPFPPLANISLLRWVRPQYVRITPPP